LPWPKPASWAAPSMACSTPRPPWPRRPTTWPCPPGCVDAGKLTLDYVEHLRVHHVSPDIDVLNVRSLDIARSAGCIRAGASSRFRGPAVGLAAAGAARSVCLPWFGEKNYFSVYTAGPQAPKAGFIRVFRSV
jgi:hypothetical protein